VRPSQLLSRQWRRLGTLNNFCLLSLSFSCWSPVDSLVRTVCHSPAPPLSTPGLSVLTVSTSSLLGQRGWNPGVLVCGLSQGCNRT
jgi:hypothetical protein